MSKKMRGNIMLLTTALIWGAAFVAQSEGMKYIGPFTYNMLRNYIAFLILIPVTYLLGKNSAEEDQKRSCETNLESNKEAYIGGLRKGIDSTTLKGGIACGLALAVASALQQTGVSMTSAGKAGFLTSLYIIFVPILGIFLRKRIPRIVWLCVFLAICGFYLLCVKDGFSISKGDLFCLGCAVGFSVHIMVVDHFAEKNTDGILMSCIQFLTAAVFSSILTFLFENPTWEGILGAGIPILYAGVLSSGVGFTLQIIAQKDTNPTVATLLMSLESVFSVLFGWLLLHESLSGRELLGCLLVFVAVILCQIPSPEKS